MIVVADPQSAEAALTGGRPACPPARGGCGHWSPRRPGRGTDGSPLTWIVPVHGPAVAAGGGYPGARRLATSPGQPCDLPGRRQPPQPDRARRWGTDVRVDRFGRCGVSGPGPVPRDHTSTWALIGCNHPWPAPAAHPSDLIHPPPSARHAHIPAAACRLGHVGVQISLWPSLAPSQRRPRPDRQPERLHSQ